MKKLMYFALSALMLMGCSNQSEEEMVNGRSSMVNEQQMTLSFSPYGQELMTRATTSIANVVNHLDVWITECNDTILSHQTTADAGFGTISVTLDKTKEYTLYAIGHKCSTDASLKDSLIIFPEDKVTHSMFYTTIFKPDTVTSLNCEMNRIVSQFRLETTDSIPKIVKKMRFTINSVYNRWHVSKGATNSINKVSTFENFNRKTDGSAIFSIYSIVTDTKTPHDITIEALNEKDSVIQIKHLPSVPLRNGYKITYRGEIFTDKVAAAGFFVDADLLDDGTVTF